MMQWTIVATLICMMQWTIAAKGPMEVNHKGVGLDVEYCLPGSVYLEAKVISSPLFAFFK